VRDHPARLARRPARGPWLGAPRPAAPAGVLRGSRVSAQEPRSSATGVPALNVVRGAGGGERSRGPRGHAAVTAGRSAAPRLAHVTSRCGDRGRARRGLRCALVGPARAGPAWAVGAGGATHSLSLSGLGPTHGVEALWAPSHGRSSQPLSANAGVDMAQTSRVAIDHQFARPWAHTLSRCVLPAKGALQTDVHHCATRCFACARQSACVYNAYAVGGVGTHDDAGPGVHGRSRLHPTWNLRALTLLNIGATNTKHSSANVPLTRCPRARHHLRGPGHHRLSRRRRSCRLHPGRRR